MRSLLLLLVLCTTTIVTTVAAESGDHRIRKAVLKTRLGEIVVRLEWEKAPENCATFVRYIAKGIYRDTSFHEGDALGIYGGKPSQKFEGISSVGNMSCDEGPAGEFALPHKRGGLGFCRTVGSCNPPRRSNSTQIFIRVQDKPAANGEFTVFATIEQGMDVVDAIQAELTKGKPVSFSADTLD